MPNQYAYTPTIGTTDALVKFTADIVNSLDYKDCVAVRSLMLDFSKAFDCMRPEIAVNKILNQIATQLDLSEASLVGRAWGIMRQKIGKCAMRYAIKNKGLCDRLCDGTYHNLQITA